MTGKKPPTCQYVVEETRRGRKLCGTIVELHELPQDPRWPVLCGEHLRTWTSRFPSPQPAVDAEKA